MMTAVETKIVTYKTCNTRSKIELLSVINIIYVITTIYT